MTTHQPPSILLATLGTEPQVVTAALDLLQRRGERLDQVHVLHTVAPGTPIEAAVARLASTFDQPPYHDHIPLHLLPIRDQTGHPLSDVDTPQASQVAFRFIYDQVRQLKSDGFRLHLCLAGGRKPLALFAMAAAQLLFDEHDRLWHLHSSGEFLTSKRLHPTPEEDAHLVPIPVILWSRVSPILTGLGQIADPFEAADLVRDLQLDQRLESMRSFILGALTPAERRVVALLVQEGLSDAQIASRLHLSPRTVEGQLRAAYAKAAAHWDLPTVTRSQLVALLNLYYALDAGPGERR